MMGYGRGESLTSFLTFGLFEAAMSGYAQDYVNITSKATKMFTDFYVKPWNMATTAPMFSMFPMIPISNMTDNSNYAPSETDDN